MPEPTDHYFADRAPAGDAQRRRLTVELGGRSLALESAGGVFSPGGLDPATALLLEEAPDPPGEGDLLDLGCGWGPIALDLALRSPGSRVWAVDVSERALDLTRRNAAAAGVDTVRAVRPEEVPADLAFAAIWSNPPIRVGKAALHGLLAGWLPRLAKGSDAHLVVGKNLGADSLARWVDAELGLPVERVVSRRGFRVLRVTHP